MMDWMKTQCRRSGDCTHLSLGKVKGSFTVATSLEDAFLLKYARAVTERQEELSLIEVKRETFPLFADLDWTSGGGDVDDAQMVAVAKFVSQQAFLIYAPTSSEHTVVVATRQPVRQGAHFKNGMHLHWPTITTNAASAQIFRQTAVERCKDRFGEGAMGGKPWQEVVDEHVYKGSGLRMLYSRKQVPEDAYRPRWELRLVLATVSQLQQAVVEGVEDIPQATDPDSAHRWVRTCSVRAVGGHVTPLQACVQELDTGPTGGGDPKEACAVAEHQAGLAALQKVLPVCYHNCRFVKLVKGTDRAFLTPDTRVCLNLAPDASGAPRAHKSNNVYFVVGQETTYQACFCSCDTSDGRLQGPCKNFRSNHFPTPSELAASLFPKPVIPFACGGAAFTTPEASATEMYDRFFGKPSKPAAGGKRKRRQKM